MWFKTPWPSYEPFWHQAIIQTNAGMLSIRNINGNSNIFIKNVFENVLCEMAAILTRPQSVNVIYYHARDCCDIWVRTVAAAGLLPIYY